MSPRGTFRTAAILLLVLCTGCGYLPLRSGNTPRTVSVPMFENRTHHPSIETVLAAAITEELAYRGWRVERDAEYSLVGKVVSYTAKPASYSGQDLAMSYRALVRVEAALVEKGTGRHLWKREFEAEKVYSAHDVPVLQRRSEDEAVRLACREVAAKVFAAMTEDF